MRRVIDKLAIAAILVILLCGVAASALILYRPAHAEALENVNPAKLAAQCSQWLSDHNTVGIAARQGHCDEMKELTRDVEGVEDARRAKIMRLVDEVCSSKDIDVWFERYAKQCMGVKD